MVKFSKQFEGQLVPEWKEAFVDYCQLKKDLKTMHHLLTNNSNNNNEKDSNYLRKQHHTFFSSLMKLFPLSQQHKQHEVIQVHRKLASSASKGDEYETELFEQFAGSNAIKDFFTCLDHQLNKVNQFYKTKEKEFLDRGECLKRQTEILVELKSALKEQREKESRASGSREDASLSSTLSCEDDSTKDGAKQEKVIDETTDDLEQNDMQMEFADLSKEDGLEKPMRMKSEDGRSRLLSSQVFNCQGKTLKINIPLTTPTRTLSAFNYLIWGDLIHQSFKKCSADGTKMNMSKTKLNRAEKMIRGAFLELYKGLNYLKTYRNLNMLAFVKILKKLDKITGKQVLPIYLKVVETSYFNCSNKAINLADEVEELFIKHFAEEDRKKAMMYLKPHHRRESHGTTFFIGLFTGCFIALFAGYAIMAHITGMYRRSLRGDSLYMETIYPILSMFSLLFLHFFLYGCNIFAWRKTRINYSFIFELSPTKELKYRDVFLICTTSMTVVMGVMFAHLVLLTKGYSYSQAQVIPGFLLLVFSILLICPFDIAYHSSRYRFLKVIRNIILSPLYKVVMLDFFMADQLCSQVPMFRHLEFITCYYITGSYKTQDYGHCMGTKNYRDLAYAVSFLPYYWRAMQCARRWFDEGETSHLINLGKYVSAMLAAGAKVAYEKEKSVGYLCLVIIISSAATIYQLYWDFVKDWGLLQMNCKNPWLRNDLMLRQKSIYYISMVLNLILRLAWLQTVLHYNFENVDFRVTGLFLAALEVLRRGLWNFYRLENEHLNNAGKFRAVKMVPLPFHEVDEEE